MMNDDGVGLVVVHFIEKKKKKKKKGFCEMRIMGRK